MDVLTLAPLLAALVISILAFLDSYTTKLKLAGRARIDDAVESALKTQLKCIEAVNNKVDNMAKQNLELMKLVHARWSDEDNTKAGDGDAC